MLPDEKNNQPIELLKEIEAYLAFRLTGEKPNIPEDQMRDMKRDIVKCLKANGVDV